MEKASHFPTGTCAKCNLRFEDLGMGWRLVPTGFVIFDITCDRDVPELDECRETGCPGRQHSDSMEHRMDESRIGAVGKVAAQSASSQGRVQLLP
jgi:hypothetical protein